MNSETVDFPNLNIYVSVLKLHSVVRKYRTLVILLLYESHLLKMYFSSVLQTAFSLTDNLPNCQTSYRSILWNFPMLILSEDNQQLLVCLFYQSVFVFVAFLIIKQISSSAASKIAFAISLVNIFTLLRCTLFVLENTRINANRFWPVVNILATKLLPTRPNQ